MTVNSIDQSQESPDLLRLQLQSLIEKEAEIDQQLEVLLQESRIELIDSKFRALLDTKQLLFQQAGDAANQIQDSIKETSSDVANLYNKIKDYDLESQDIRQQLKTLHDSELFVEMVQDIADIMQQQQDFNLQMACDQIKIFNERFSDFTAVDLSVEIGGESMDVEACKKFVQSQSLTLKKIIDQRLQRYQESKQDAQWTQTWRLLPLISQQKHGMECLTNNLIQSMRRDLPVPGIDASSEKIVRYVATLVDYIAQLLTRFKQVILKSYGVYGLMYLLKGLEAELELQGCRILDVYNDSKSLNSLLQRVQIQSSMGVQTSSKFKSQSQTQQQDANIDMKDVASVVTDLVAFSHHFVLVRLFMQSFGKEIQSMRAQDAIQQTDDLCFEFLNNPQLSKDDLLSKNSKLTDRVKELMSITYVQFESFMITQSVNKAVANDKYVEDEQHGENISSCVDTTFFVLKKSISRAIQSCNADIVCSIVNIAVSVLDSTFYRGLNNKVLSNFGANVQYIVENRDLLGGYVILLNDFDVAAKYTVRLSRDIQHQVDQFMVVTNYPLNVKDLILSCLQSLDEFQGRFQEAMMDGVQVLYMSLYKSIVKQLVSDSLKTAKNGYHNIDKFRQGVNVILKECHLMRGNVVVELISMIMEVLNPIYIQQMESVKSLQDVKYAVQSQLSQYQKYFQSILEEYDIDLDVPSFLSSKLDPILGMLS
ncbi:hypothetical protein MIR68_006115 [Amoeboaphelidium protococcarum]|nr:hypothetical protein MIR68_006115 [Amoeboaphelidium protococcarum]